jgi:hypothetical protein
LANEAVAKLAADEKTSFLWPVVRGGIASPLRADGGLPRRAGEEGRAQLDAKGRFCSPASFAIGSVYKLIVKGVFSVFFRLVLIKDLLLHYPIVLCENRRPILSGPMAAK